MPSNDPVAAMSAKLAATTGKSLDQWTAIALKSGRSKHGELVGWLKSEHQLTHGYANLVAHTAFKSDAASQTADGKDLVSEMFGGDKAALRPIFDALMSALLSMGSDIEQVPKKGYLSVKRTTQFVTLHPSTKTRFDVGVKLRGVAAKGRLEAAGSWNGMVTHRIRLASPEEVDDEIVEWLRRAYAEA